jgi:hypothetical protein
VLESDALILTKQIEKLISIDFGEMVAALLFLDDPIWHEVRHALEKGTALLPDSAVVYPTWIVPCAILEATMRRTLFYRRAHHN